MAGRDAIPYTTSLRSDFGSILSMVWQSAADDNALASCLSISVFSIFICFQLVRFLGDLLFRYFLFRMLFHFIKQIID